MGEGSSDDDEVIQNTRRNSGSLQGEGASSGAPPNPFERTLATLEPQSIAPQDKEENPAPEKLGARPGRASMDVDSFKRLLMTGSTAPSTSEPSSSAPGSHLKSGLHPDNGSSTDTSSTSHQSIFEPIPETRTESPRTSYEMDISDDDEGANLIEEGPPPPKKEKKQKPPPPKHKHGKGLQPPTRAPQTVSFFDFTPSFSSVNEKTPGIQVSSQSVEPGTAYTPSDLNKPLPPNPPISSPLHSSGISGQQPTMSSNPGADAFISPKKMPPPPPPLSRRHSQLKSSSASTRSRSNSNLSTKSQIIPDTPSSSLSLETSNVKSPPPPPARRSGPPTSGTPLKDRSHIPQHSKSDLQELESHTQPEPEQPSIANIVLPPHSYSQTPLESSRDSITKSGMIMQRPSRSASGSSVAPPPPPPRRSHRFSRDGDSPSESRRSSMEIHPARRASGASLTSSLRREVATNENSTTKLQSENEVHATLAEATITASSAKEKMAEQVGMVSEAAGEGPRDGKVAGVDDFLKGLDDLQKEIDEMRGRQKP